ncbi:hypothetical protein A3755_02940 [Oleiphilus sp. HI0085]|nr:hypothetical protein A3755_02940 [Oleiphilus sp. HI0085]
MNMVKTSVVFVVLFAISLSTFAAKNDTAFELFTDAERALEEGDLNESKRLAENAINLVPGDGRITINKQAKYRFASFGRGLKPVRYYDGDDVDYRPNKLLRKVKEKARERSERLRATLKNDNPPRLVVEPRLVDSDSDGIYYEDETLEIQVLIRNEGEGLAENVKLIIDGRSSMPSLLFKSFIGEIPPNSERIHSQTILLPREYDDDELDIVVKAEEMDGFGADIAKSSYQIHEWEEPRIRITTRRTFESLKPGRTSKYELIAENIGSTPARNIAIHTELETKGIRLVDEQWPERIALLAPGERLPLTLFLRGDLELDKNTKPEFSIHIKDLGIDDAKHSIKRIANYSLHIEEGFRYHHSGNVKQYAVSNIGLAEEDKRPARISKNRIEHTDNYALVIGNRNYSKMPGLPVRYALKDAKLMADVFEKNMGIPSRNIAQYHDVSLGEFKTIIGANGKPGKFQRSVNGLSEGKANTVFVFYSGHGVPAINDKWAAYLMPSDATPDSIDVSGYHLDEFYRQLSLIDAENIVVFLDACFSGNAHDGTLYPNVSASVLRRPLISVPTKIRAIDIKALGTYLCVETIAKIN